MADGTWEVRLTASDASGHSSRASTNVVIQTGVRKLGRLRLEFAEFAVQTRAASVAVKRIYDGLDLTSGPLGHGWRFDFDVGHGERSHPLKDGWQTKDVGLFLPELIIVPAADHLMTYVLPDGRVYQFIVDMELPRGLLPSLAPTYPTFTEVTSRGATLTPLRADFSAYSVTDFRDNIYVPIPADGGTIIELNTGNDWEPAYYRLHTDFGEDITYEGRTGRPVKFDDGTGVKLEYSSTGVRLNGQDVIRLELGTDGLVSAATNTLSGEKVSYARESNGDLTTVTLADGNKQTFVYAAGSRLISYTTGNLAPERYEYDERGRITLRVASTGEQLRTTYDDIRRMVVSTDPAGSSVTTLFNADGNPTSVTDPFGNTTTFTYVPGTSKETSRTDPLGHTWQTQYDSRDRATVHIDPLGHKTQLTYVGNFDRATVAIDGEGRTFKENLDNQGRPTAWILPDGTTVRSFTYPDDRTRVETDARGRTTTTVFDEQSRMVSEIDDYGTTTNSYNDVNHSVEINKADGTKSTANIDFFGRMTRLQTSVGTIQYTYGM